MYKRLLLTGLIVLGIAGFGYWSDRGPDFMTVIVRNSPYDLRLEPPGEIRTGTPVALVIRPFKNGKPVDVIQDKHSLHAVLASSDGEDMRHTVSFRYREDGAAELDQTFSRPGSYRLWIEVGDDMKENPHGTNAELVAWADVVTVGEPLPVATPPTEGKSVSGSGFTLTMSHGPLVPGSPAEIRFVVTDPNGNPVVLPMHDPILFGLVNEDRSFFLHGHMFTDPGWRAASYTVTPPRSGRYHLLTQAFWFDGVAFRLLEAHFRIAVPSAN